MPMFSPITIKSLAAFSFFLLSGSFALAQTAQSIGDDRTGLGRPPPFYKQLDPDMRRVVEVWNEIRGLPIYQATPQDDRQQFFPQDASKVVARSDGIETPFPVGKVTDGITIPGRDGNQIPIRIYTPSGTGPFPVITYYHGGGFVLGSIDIYDESPRELSTYAGAIVVSVSYRLAPEFKFPAGYNDCVDAYKWVLANIASYGGNSSQVAIAGESAGGDLAAEVAIAARDQGLQKPTHVLLVYPVISGNLNQPSDLRYTNSFLPLNLDDLKFYFSLAANPSDANDPRLLPINNDLHNLPPHTIINAEVDPLLDDGQLYATALKAAGNQVVHRVYKGVTHEFFGMGAVVAKARAAEQFGAESLAASFK
jgi:acetyl esterase